MKYLFVDDQVSHLKELKEALKDAGHVVVTARDLDKAWEQIEEVRKTNHPFDLVLIDFGMDRKGTKFEQEDKELRDALRARGKGDLPISGQALGLRLWRRRKELQQRYCYITNFAASQIWIERFDGQDPEFGGKILEKLDDILVLNKSNLWHDNIEKKLQHAYQAWEDEGWWLAKS